VTTALCKLAFTITITLPGTGFYGSNDPTNSVTVLEDKILRIRLQSHQVCPTVLQ